MGWPDSGMLWREDAKPAQKQYADVAKAISQFEPVVMMANPEVWLVCTSPAYLAVFTLLLGEQGQTMHNYSTSAILVCIMYW